MIIYGWGYFNRRDHSVVRGGCPSCGRGGYMKSYTSSKFFTLYFIPLIPLGTQKIVKECPHCKAALGMPLRKFRKLRETELPRLVTEYESKPADAEAAKNVLGAIINLQDRGALRRVGPQIRRAFERDADMMGLLASTHSYLCLDKEADELFLAAVALSDDKDLAAEANSHIESQKLPKPAPPNRLLQSAPVLIVPAALLFALTWFVQQAATSSFDQTYILSGLTRPYSLQINGETVHLPPMGRIGADMLVSGRNAIGPTPDDNTVATQLIDIHLPWQRRFFGGPVVIVNPDRAALLVWERMGYGSGLIPQAAYDARISVGRSLYQFDDIDYLFTDFPESVMTPKGSAVSYRSRLSDASAFKPAEVVQALVGRNQTTQLHDYLRAKLQANDGGAEVIHLGAAFLPRADFLALAENRLASRPVDVEWHRAYQNEVEHTSEGADLVTRYRVLAEANPRDSALWYLYGRILDDPDQSRATLERAASLPEPCPFAPSALAFFHVAEGDYSKALELATEAERIAPGNFQFRRMHRTALHGLKDYARLNREAGDPFAAAPDAESFREHVYCLVRLGDAAGAHLKIARFLAELSKTQKLDDESRRLWNADFECTVAVAEMDREAYGNAAARAQDPGWTFQRTVLAGHLAEAANLAKAPESRAGLVEHLLLYILAARAGQAELASAELVAAREALQKGDGEQRRWADWLGGDEAPDPRRAAHACYDLDNHHVYLSALAARFPERASEYLERASRMRFRDSFYSLALLHTGQQ